MLRDLETFLGHRVLGPARKFGGAEDSKCSDRSIEHSALLGNYDRPTDWPTDQSTQRPTDMRRSHREVTLPIKKGKNSIVPPSFTVLTYSLTLNHLIEFVVN